MSNVLDDVDPELFRTYAFWNVILVVKMLAMSQLTSLTRFRKMAFANPEDVSPLSRKLKPKFDDPDVERMRRAHRNDLENILPFFVVAFLYLLTRPDPTLATHLIRAAAIGRIVHSIVYAVIVLPQPARLLSYGMTLLVTGFMACKCILHFL
ncbi:microsomal glutathione S-transferase 1-like [Toxorhynchites rutilus septentrionalis]|uniref:microsomal glutathione S-transferase 1-like n=1 Tax=Toxorhynchites rutilus septentrionalis TaxID=329112 RepID=UPI00247A630A|nr:microsomal glutathione S-transferase 1-like [Toxorhynchites rutilus septentrionalis]